MEFTSSIIYALEREGGIGQSPTCGVLLTNPRGSPRRREPAYLGFCGRELGAPMRETNWGMWPVTFCRMPGPNSRKRFIPASFPTVEPKSLSGAAPERARWRREALSAATEVSTRTKYRVFSLRFPDASRVTKILEAASVARSITLSLDEG